METLVSTISFILLLGLIITPILLFVWVNKRKQRANNFLVYLTFGLIITTILIFTAAWWGDFSTELLLGHYGYDFDAMNDTERFQKVAAENLERVKQLEIGYMGIGWTLQGAFSFIFYSPYLLLLYGVGFLVRRRKSLTLANRKVF